MRLTFKRSNQQEADALRKLLDETVENEEVESRHNRGSSVPAFKTDASASFVEKDESSMYGRKTEKEWQFIVTLEADLSQFKDGEGDGGLQSRIWSKLFAKLMQRPAIGRGTNVAIHAEFTPEQYKYLQSLPGELTMPKFVEALLAKAAARGHYADSEGRHVKASQIGYTLTISGRMLMLCVDAVDAPIARKVLDETIDDTERDMVRRAAAAVREAAAKAVKS